MFLGILKLFMHHLRPKPIMSSYFWASH